MTPIRRLEEAIAPQEFVECLAGEISSDSTFFGTVVVKINGNPLSLAAYQNIAMKTSRSCRSIEQMEPFLTRVRHIHTRYTQEKAAMTLFQRVVQCALSFFRKDAINEAVNRSQKNTRSFFSLREQLERMSNGQIPDSERYYAYLTRSVQSCITKVLEENPPITFTAMTRQLDIALRENPGWERETNHFPVYLLREAFYFYRSETEMRPDNLMLAIATVGHCLETMLERSELQ